MRMYTYPLRPNNRQASALEFLLWQSRLVYNLALEQRITTYRDTGKRANFYHQSGYFHELRRKNPDTLGKLNADSMDQTLRRLDNAFTRFFKRVRVGETPGFPKFKSRGKFHSFVYKYGDGCKLRFYPNNRARFYVQNVGVMRMCYHRALPENTVIKQVVVKLINGKWNACLMVELPDLFPTPEPSCAIGIDVGLKSLLAFSDGTLIENPNWLRQNLSKLRIANRRASRRQKDSHRKRKAYQQVARLYAKIASQRRDCLHKITRQLVDHYTLLAIEDLPMAFMKQNKYMARASYDAGLGTFRRLLEYKAKAAGTQVVAVTPYNTSQRCSQCGELVPKDLDTRIHSCPHCGLVLDRDVNAARNILQAALAQVNTG